MEKIKQYTHTTDQDGESLMKEHYDGSFVKLSDHERIVKESYQRGFDNGYQRGRDKEEYINNPSGK